MFRFSFPKWAAAAVTVVGALLLLLIDLETPIGLAIPFLYIVLTPFIVSLRSRTAIVGAVLIVLVMSVVGFWASTLEGGDFAALYTRDDFIRDTILNRALAVALFTGVLFLLVRIRSAQDDLHRLSTTDPLTGALNRRHFHELAEIERRRAQRSGSPMSVLMLDIDHFKRVNDRFGHAAGDAAIRELARVCHKTLRPGDLFGRWGGEEFVVALPETSLDAAMKTAERLREKLGQATFPANGKPHSITVSVGASSLQSDELAVDHAIDRADRALYRAKANGRNRSEREPATA